MSDHDAFLSHNSKDKKNVKIIAEGLKIRGLTVWLDEWHLRPGDEFILGIDEGMRNSRSILVFIGPHGIGPWERPEVLSALEAKVQNKVRVIPVILPGGIENWDDTLPSFLRSIMYVNFGHDLEDTDTLDRLYYGITGKNVQSRTGREEETGQATAPVPDNIDEAVSWLLEFLEMGKLTLFLGRNIGRESGGRYRMTKGLLAPLQLAGDESCHLLPTPETAATYFAIQMGDAMLEDRVYEMAGQNAGKVSPIHRALTAFLTAMDKQPKPRRRNRTNQLIISTAYDLLMESAMLKAGQPFTQVVQGRRTRGVVVKEFKDIRSSDDSHIQVTTPSGVTTTVAVNDLEQLENLVIDFESREIPEAENLQLQNLTQPILYKVHGSFDISQSCLISTDHYYDYFWNMAKQMIIPPQLSQIIANTPILFLGICPLDQQFRFTYQAILRKGGEIAHPRRFAVKENPDTTGDDCFKKLESKMWERIKTEASTRYGIEILETKEIEFLEKLTEKLTFT
ncbi:MAG: TIR domain-containing protein [Desulfobacteraceae bacterium]|nr:TIR domain-containing protein [Desulfobacteraceae bacterium]